MEIKLIIAIAVTALSVGIATTLSLVGMAMNSSFKINLANLFCGIIGCCLGLVLGLTSL